MFLIDRTDSYFLEKVNTIVCVLVGLDTRGDLSSCYRGALLYISSEQT